MRVGAGDMTRGLDEQQPPGGGVGETAAQRNVQLAVQHGGAQNFVRRLVADLRRKIQCVIGSHSTPHSIFRKSGHRLSVQKCDH
jgi:hypothetical protein